MISRLYSDAIIDVSSPTIKQQTFSYLLFNILSLTSYYIKQILCPYLSITNIMDKPTTNLTGTVPKAMDEQGTIGKQFTGRQEFRYCS